MNGNSFFDLKNNGHHEKIFLKIILEVQTKENLSLLEKLSVFDAFCETDIS